MVLRIGPYIQGPIDRFLGRDSTYVYTRPYLNPIYRALHNMALAYSALFKILHTTSQHAILQHYIKGQPTTQQHTAAPQIT